MKVIIVKEVMAGDVSPVVMFQCATPRGLIHDTTVGASTLGQRPSKFTPILGQSPSKFTPTFGQRPSKVISRACMADFSFSLKIFTNCNSLNSCMVCSRFYQLFWKFEKDTLNLLHTPSLLNANRQTSNFLMAVYFIVCTCSFCISPEFLLRQHRTRLHEYKSILMVAVFECFFNEI